MTASTIPAAVARSANLLEVAPDRADPRVLRWKFQHGDALIVVKTLARFPTWMIDRQVLGLVGSEPELPADVDDLIRTSIASALPLLQLAQRGRRRA